MAHVGGKLSGDEVESDLPEEYQEVLGSGNPFGLFTLTMTEGTVAAGRGFGADLVVYTSDHAAGALTAAALGVPGLEVGNRVSWSMRDADFRSRMHLDEVAETVRAQFGIGEAEPELVARVDPRAPSMDGIREDEPDQHDGVPWWPMLFVLYNGGAVLPDWVLCEPAAPRVCVTLGTVVPSVVGISSLEVVIEALGGMDVEVVLAGELDLSSLGPLPSNVYSAGFLALSAFLGTCSLIIHHGGSGTTAAPLHYGVPQLVLPSFADNPMSAARVVERGVGLSRDPQTIDVETVRSSAQRLLVEPSFAEAAAEVRAEMTGQPSPAAVLERAVAAVAER